MVGAFLYVHGGEVAPGLAASDMVRIDLSPVLRVFNDDYLVTSCLRFGAAAEQLPELAWDVAAHDCATMPGPVLQHAIGLMRSQDAPMLVLHGGLRSTSMFSSDSTQVCFCTAA
jgi:hypothetical protein